MVIGATRERVVIILYVECAYCLHGHSLINMILFLVCSWHPLVWPLCLILHFIFVGYLSSFQVKQRKIISCQQAYFFSTLFIISLIDSLIVRLSDV